MRASFVAHRRTHLRSALVVIFFMTALVPGWAQADESAPQLKGLAQALGEEDEDDFLGVVVATGPLWVASSGGAWAGELGIGRGTKKRAFLQDEQKALTVSLRFAGGRDFSDDENLWRGALLIGGLVADDGFGIFIHGTAGLLWHRQGDSEFGPSARLSLGIARVGLSAEVSVLFGDETRVQGTLGLEFRRAISF